MAELIVAAVVGVAVGWILRGSCKGAAAAPAAAPAPADDQLEKARTQIAGLEAMVNGRDAAITALEKTVAELRAKA